MRWTMLGALMAVGCSQAQADQATPPDTAETGVGVEEPLAGDNPGEGDDYERTGEARQQIIWRQAICQASMITGGALGCAAVGLYCSGVTTITVGGLALPCALVTVAACTSLAAMVDVYKTYGCTLR